MNLPSLDTLNHVAQGTYDAQNKDVVSMPAGSACAVHSSGTGIVRADGSQMGYQCVGILQGATAATFSGTVQREGPFELSDWSLVTDEGDANLTPRAIYFISPTNKGKITRSWPTATGQVLQHVGRAVSATTLEILPMVPILL